MKKTILPVIFIALNVYFSDAQQWLDFSKFHTGTEYIQIPNLSVTGHNITVEALITKTVADTGLLMQQDVLSKHYDTINVNYILRDWCFVMSTTSGYAVLENPLHLRINVPYHIAATYDGDSVKYYVNGCEVSSMAFTGDMLQNNYPTTIGNRFWPRDEKFPGYINEVRIWNVTRTQEQIEMNMDTLASPTNQPGLLAYYNFGSTYVNLQGNSSRNGQRAGLIDFGANPYWHDTLSYVCGLAYANFAAGRTNLCSGNCVNFYDLSSIVDSWQWTFKGGIPSVSTERNPKYICYDTPGMYDVSLIINANGGSDSLTFANYIVVNNPPPTPVITVSGNTLYCKSNPSYISYLWFNDTLLIPGATDTLITINGGGNYKVVVTDKNGCVASADYSSIIGILNPLTHDYNDAIIMYPNPVTTYLVLKQIWGNNMATRIEVYTLLGQLVKEEKVKPFREMALNVENLPKGVYFLKLTSDNGKWLGKFVKQ